MTDNRPLPRRIVIAGTTGSGKSTTARRLAAMIGARCIELDALHWEPNWQPAAEDVFRARVREAIAAPAWVVDGGYGMVRDLTWGNAEAMIWLDFSYPRIFWQLLTRTIRRRLRNEVLWNGNRERLRAHLNPKESLFTWQVRSHWRHRREYPKTLAQPPYAHIDVTRVRAPRELERALARYARRESASGEAKLAAP